MRTENPDGRRGTIAHGERERRAGFLDAVMGRMFRRREPRRLVRGFVLGLLMELEDHDFRSVSLSSWMSDSVGNLGLVGGSYSA